MEYYKRNAKKGGDAYKKKLQYDKVFGSTKKQKKDRAKHNRINHENGTYGNGDKKDWSKTTEGKYVSENQSDNRARVGKRRKPA